MRKVSYTIPCSSRFRDAVEALARRRGCNAGDLARSVVLMLPMQSIAQLPDPGGPLPGDRETVERKSGPDKGGTWRRKPRLQVRLPAGYDPIAIRRALGLALALADGKAAIDVELDGKSITDGQSARERRDQAEEIVRLRASVSALSFEPFDDGVETRSQALHVLGFPPDSRPGPPEVRARFRVLATIHHPDNAQGDHRRMTQLNEAFALLRAGL
ncbi:MAG: J domain-containing protein [Rhodospirillales bacterium]